MSVAANSGASSASLDVIVIGGGAAGLSAALYLGRSRRRTLVVDAGEPRNGPAHSAHGMFTRDGVSPMALLDEARRQATAYPTVELWRAKAESVVKGPSGFVVHTQDGREAQARRLLFATGIRDELPPIQGLAERWANGVLHCVYCHGYEIADQPVALIAEPDVAVRAAASVWARRNLSSTAFVLLRPTSIGSTATRPNCESASPTVPSFPALQSSCALYCETSAIYPRDWAAN
jgi:thioredoxin reductase